MKILMTMMGLDIGGAETHVVELSIMLAKKGHIVHIASNGGVYEEELKKNNIVHYKVPLHNKKIHNVISSYLRLEKIISREKYDVVHAHARIPSFICGLLKKRLKFKFVTTAHWVFKTSFIWRRLSNWGQRSLAVSEDIKKYLIDCYDQNPHKITVTVNGVNTERFSENVDFHDIVSEFALSEENINIVHVSRIDSGRSKVSFMLAELMRKIKNDRLRLVIVGSGNDFGRLELLVNQINKEFGFKKIILTGARTDVNKFASFCDLFVGVSRAALEAMACAKPVILAGDEGYIGIFDESTSESAVKSNFCCRDCQETDMVVLQSDIEKILGILSCGSENSACSKEKIRLMGEFNKNYIVKNYSVERMYRDCIGVYEDVLKSRENARVIISGYYGFGNQGDDSLLRVIVDNLKKQIPDIEIITLSRNPGLTRRIYGVKSISRTNIPCIVYNMLKGGLLINGGGSLLQDVTSTKSLIYYLFIIFLSDICGMRCAIYANGIGPIKKEKNRHLTKMILSRLDYISLRDKDSYDELKCIGVDSKKMVLTVDPAFALVEASKSCIEEIFMEESLDYNDDYCVISVRKWKYECENFKNIVSRVGLYVQEKYGYKVILIPMQHSFDMRVAEEINDISGNKFKILRKNYTGDEVLGIISNTKLVIAMRLHALIYSACAKVPMIALAYDPKITSALKQLEQPFVHDVSNLKFDDIKKDIDTIVEKREEIVSRLGIIREKNRRAVLNDIGELCKYI